MANACPARSMANACPARSMAALGALSFENISTEFRNVFEFLGLVFTFTKKCTRCITAGEGVTEEYRSSHYKIGEQKLALVSRFHKGS